MKHRWDIYFESPMSEDLYYQLKTYMIPVYARNFNMYHEIKLVGNTTDKIVDTKGTAGTGFSGGVDSFYTVLKHLDTDHAPNHNITHVLLTVNGAAGTGFSEEKDNEWMDEEMRIFTPLVQELGLSLIGVKSNVDSIYFGDPAQYGEVLITSSFVHALRKLFGIYYWASAYEAEIFGFVEEDGGFTENISLPYVSVKGLRFYHSGSETNRIGKVKYIADHEIVQNGLNVCGNIKSCNRCMKCIRTMSELYAINKLNLYNKIFDINDYKKHFTSRLAEEFAIDSGHGGFAREIKDEMKKNSIRIPLSVYLKQYLVYVPYCFLKLRISRLTWARKFYYKFNLDLKLTGIRQDDETRNILLTRKIK